LQAQQVLSLEEALNIGLQNNYSILVAKEELKISELENQIGTAGFLPSLDADGTYSESVENTELNFADGSDVQQDGALSSNLNLGLQVRWMIFDGTKMFITKNKLEELELISALGVKSSVNNTLAEIMMTYYGIVAEVQTYKLLEQQLEVATARTELSKTKYSIGAASELEQLQAEVDANAIRSTLFDQEVRVKQAKLALNRLLGRELDSEFEINDSIVINTTYEKEKLLQEMENNPNLNTIEKQRSIAILERKESFADRLPKVSLDGRYNYNQSESEAGFVRFNQATGFIYGASVIMPLFNGNEKNRKEQQNKVRIEQSKLRYEQEYATTKEQLLYNLELFQVNKSRVVFEEKNVELAERNLKFSMESFKQGGISALELREVQFSTFAAQERLVALKYTIKTAEIELLRLTNQLLQEQ
tara:strand:+ start:9213 stop:10469 length:1257 start_codon:yes stop_codon:yes gene_type:complete